MPRFSIIVPLFNKAPYVRKALDSIISQTFKDWELIIVDDGSTDNSAAICEEYLSTLYTIHHTPFEDIRIISQPNSGVAAARNRGVKESSGEYVCFLDADDWWDSNFLEELDHLITEYPDAGLYATNFVYYKPGKTHVEHTNLTTGYINYPEVYARTGSMPVWTGAACMPRKVFDEMGGFPVGIKLGEDFLLWAKTALHYPVAFSELPLAYYNNDVPASLRATRNLHASEHHMLFNLDPIEAEIHKTSNITHQTSVWKQLFDKLRISGLMDYWLDDRYHAAAAAELAKVDWSQQPHSAKTPYDQPIWLLRTKRCLMQIGSYCKQKLIRHFLKE
ncbi:MAG: glycosyltransferase family 2 protein [Bacteroidales bacterium]|nr:glycosyltransferase family 2 protein [Bacteroidales bacterium]